MFGFIKRKWGNKEKQEPPMEVESEVKGMESLLDSIKRLDLGTSIKLTDDVVREYHDLMLSDANTDDTIAMLSNAELLEDYVSELATFVVDEVGDNYVNHSVDIAMLGLVFRLVHLDYNLYRPYGDGIKYYWSYQKDFYQLSIPNLNTSGIRDVNGMVLKRLDVYQA